MEMLLIYMYRCRIGCLSDFKVETVGEYLDRREVLFIARHHPGNESFKEWLKLYSVRDDNGREEISAGS